MEQIATRTSFQGVTNIIRFNWHFFVFSGFFVLFLYIITFFLPPFWQFYVYILLFLSVLSTSIALGVSYYVYDMSNLYQLNWLEKIGINAQGKIINIHAGFDETSALLAQKYKNTTFEVFDFYNPLTHTEVSIKRARKAYPPYPNTKVIDTQNIPLTDKEVDVIFLFLAAHEIRLDEERILFFKELSRILKENGKIIIVEHLRDIPNFLAYNFGFFHFLSYQTWKKTFDKSNVQSIQEFKITPFLHTFILQKK